jgi:hypothetical protein
MQLQKVFVKVSIMAIVALTSFTTNRLNAQVYKSVHVDTGGTLIALLTPGEVNEVTDLTVTGTINADDYMTMKSMTVLTVIDLNSVQTDGDSIPGFAFSPTITSLILPATITSIGNNAFRGCSGLIAMTIPSLVTKIGTFAFASCSGMTSVSIPSSVTFIGQYAFAGCSGLSTVSIPSSVNSIQQWAFVACTGLDSVFLPNSIDSIGMYAFAGCSGLTSLTIPSSVTSIGYYAFVSCTNLTSVNILSDSACVIKKYAFAGCSNITSININASSGTIIGEGAFISAFGLTSLILHAPSVISIGDYTFANGTKLTSLDMPGTLISIGKYAFNNSNFLTSLVLPNSLISIGDGAFANCTGLDSITIPSSVKTIGQSAFAGCINLQIIRANAPNPIEIASNSWIFGGVNKNTCALYVPSGSKEAYQAANEWKDFINIVEFDFRLAISTDVLAMSDTAGSTAAFDITSNTEWKVSSDQIWLSISDTSGMNDGAITLTAEANPNTAERNATITVSGLDITPLTISITQAPKPALSVASDSLSIGASEGSMVLLEIFSNTYWTLSSGQAWLTTSQSSGNGDSTINFTAEANPTTATREATIIVSADRVSSQIVIITQSPKLVLSVTSDSLTIGESAGSAVLLGVISNTDWTANADQTWLLTSISSGSGEDTITLTAEANPTYATREAVITVSADGVTTQTVIVTQEAGSPTGIGEVAPIAINVYPNPVNHVVYIDGAAGRVIKIYNSQGQIVLSKSLESNHETADFSSLSFGVYLIQVGNSTWKIIK